jgi:hypothetical protein
MSPQVYLIAVLFIRSTSYAESVTGFEDANNSYSGTRVLMPIAQQVIKWLLIAVAVLGFPTALPFLSSTQSVAGSPFESGKFEDAKRAFSKTGDNAGVGRIALLQNRLEEAKFFLQKAHAEDSSNHDVTGLLAEVYYRTDRFDEASALFKEIGNNAMAEKLASFAGQEPYAIESQPNTTTVKLIEVDPLPMIEVRVNGSAPAFFLIDTGAAEIVLDSEFARRVGAKSFGSFTGIFAGGSQTQVQQGRVDEIKIGGFAIKNVPTYIKNVRQYTTNDDRPVQGIIGTVFLYHFLATVDYPGREFVLRKRLNQTVWPHAIHVPFWLAGDHYIYAWGTINGAGPYLFFVDSGLAGGGFTGPPSTLRAAGVSLDGSSSTEGIGRAGKVQGVPFTVKELTLGKAMRRNVPGVALPNFPEMRHGFRSGGMVSHEFLKSYRVTYDFGQMEVLLQARSRPARDAR